MDEKSLKDKVEATVDEFIRPGLQMDGGDIEIVEVDEATGVVKVRLQGACSGCPMSAITLAHGVQRTLMAKIPEVKQIVPV